MNYSRETILENTNVKALKGEITHKLSFKLPGDVEKVVENIGLNTLNQRLMDPRPDCRLEEVDNALYLVTLFIAQEGVFSDNIKYDLMKSALKDFKTLISEEMPNI